ncbi:MAG: sulfite exporter TauE/SafE family protein, partial [Betaproteobacteria bacterium]|nr:sulfite exporter TauE/SafE family protein [Betaproteobacteria bacterium]
DVSRLGIYSRQIVEHRADLNYGLLGAAVIAAFAGAILGNRYLPKVKMSGIRGIVATLLFIVALGLITGVL